MTFLCIEYGKNLDGNKFFKKVKNRCKQCSNRNFKKLWCGKFFTKKWLNTHLEQKYHQNESISNVTEKPEIDNVNNNNRTILVGPSFSGKTYPMLKILSRLSSRDVYKFTKPSPEQYSNS